MRSMTKQLKELMKRAASWPDAAQAELVQIGLEIEAQHKGGVYHATAEELQAIDEALAQVERGEVVSEKEAEAAFAKFRGA